MHGTQWNVPQFSHHQWIESGRLRDGRITMRLPALVPLFILVGIQLLGKTAQAQTDPGRRIGSLLGYEWGSDELLVGARGVTPVRERRWFPDRTTTEVVLGFERGISSTRLYFDDQFILARRRGKPLLLFGVGFGGVLRESPGQHGFQAGLSVSVEPRLRDRLNGLLMFRALAGTGEPQDTYQVLLGFTRD